MKFKLGNEISIWKSKKEEHLTRLHTLFHLELAAVWVVSLREGRGCLLYWHSNWNKAGNYTEKNMLCFLTNINRFHPCFKTDWFRLVIRSAKDIRPLMVTGSKPALGKGFGQSFRGLKTIARHWLRTSDRQISSLTLMLIHHLGLWSWTV